MTDLAIGMVYSDKLQLYVVCLNSIELASDADKAFQLDKWASFFRAKTWEELQMIVKDNPTLEQAAGHLHKLTQEEKIRYQCEARERWLLFERSKAESRKELEKDLSEKTRELNQKTLELSQKSQELDQKSLELDQKSLELDQQVLKNTKLSDENARLLAEIDQLKKQL